VEETSLVVKRSADRQAGASRGEGMAVSRVARRSIVCAIRMHGRAGILLLLIAFTACDRRPSPPHLTLATTTSVGNSGLLDQLMPAFAREHRSEVRPRLVGSGLALRMLARGDADIVISHAPAAEAKALSEHPGWLYRKIMFNNFVLVGPPGDPAHAKGASDAATAMRRIASSTARFLSRGDLSGTHEREELLWQAAGMRPPVDQVVVAGAGMGTTLRIASETGAYTLTDGATFAQHAATLRLIVVIDGGVEMVNTYAVVVDPAGPRARAAQRFFEWISEGTGREVINGYRVNSTVEAFTLWPDGRPREQPGDLPR
jgi:tungstate transport system substrate-binding protein